MRDLQRKVTLALIVLLWSTTAIAQYSEGDLLKEANSLFDKKAYADAMPLYAQLLSLNPTSPELNYKYGATALYGDASKKDEAIKYLKFASSKGGVPNQVYYFLGRGYHLNYQFSDAISAYEKFQSIDSKAASNLQVDQDLAACRNGLQLLSQIKDIQVIDKKQSGIDAFFRFYDLSEIGGKILVTPEDLLTALDKKNSHRSLVHFRGPGSDVYFSSYGKDGKNGLDIYRAQVLPDGSFSTPQALGPAINSPYDEDYPFLHPDNQTFYFSSKGHTSMGGYDIFQSQFNAGAGNFSKPENLDFAVNTPDDELFYIADSTKNRANFASARSSRQGQVNVYQVKVQGIPLELTLIKGAFKNKIDPNIKLAKITVIDAASNQEIDSQFTDPNSGDYVLSFPKSGRYKFLVEVDKGKTVHAGSVVVPKSQGLSAYIQEMELVESAGVEKLVINNLFDQSYDGDVMALAQKILRQRAELNINYDDTKEVPAALPDNSEIDLAYHTAGFSIGLNNEQIVAQADQRVAKINKEKQEVNSLGNAAELAAMEEVAKAASLTAEASAQVAQAQNGNQGDRPEKMFRAAVAKQNAELAIRRSQNALVLSENLHKLEASLDEKANDAQDHQTTLAKAVADKNYDQALESLKAEKQRQVDETAVGNTAKSTDTIQALASETKIKSDAALTKASQSRDELAGLQRTLMNKRRLRETAKGRDAKVLDEEIARLVADEQDLTALVNARYAAAEKLQAESNDAQERLELFRSIQSTDRIASTPSQSKPNLSEAAKMLDQVKIDQAAVAAYLASNPAAIAALPSEAERSYFQKQYITPEAEAIALATPKLPAAQADIAQTTSTRPTPASGTQDLATAKTTTDPTEIEKPTTAASSSSAGGIEQPTPSNSELAEAKSATSLAPRPVIAPAVKSEEESIISPSEVDASEIVKVNPTETSKYKPASKSIQNQPASASQLPSNEIAAKNLTDDAATQKRIEAEKVKINAANDWIAIIDESIAELQRGVGGSDDMDPDDLKDQLEQYTKLRADKLAEKSASETAIADMKTSRISTREQDAYARAVADVESLNASTYASLESKIDQLSVKPEYVKLTSAVDRNYIPKLVGIELSGLSAPELAEQRIALNRTFIADVDMLIRGEASSDLSETQLLELRRIKTIEILQDERIEIGELVYKARTPEAKEYTELISDVAPELAKTTPVTRQMEMSPEMAQDLAKPYSPDILVENYAIKMTAIKQMDSEIEKSAKRIYLNEDYLEALQADIQLYAVVLENNKSVDKDVLDRYNLLLRERSATIDAIHADETNLAKESQTLRPLGEGQEVNQLIASSDIKLNKTLATLDTELAGIETKSLNAEAKDRAKAAIYQKSASQIEVEVALMVYYLDQASTENEQQVLQSQIQKLDDVANSQLALVQQYTGENDMVSYSAPGTKTELRTADVSSPETTKPKPSTAFERKPAPVVPPIASLPVVVEQAKPTEKDPAQIATSLPVKPATLPEASPAEPVSAITPAAQTPSTIQIPTSSIDPVVLKGVNYKSLNANLANGILNSSLDSLAAMRGQISALSEDYELADSQTEKDLIAEEAGLIKQQMTQLDAGLVKNLARSNAAEIEYYLATNERLMESLREEASVNADQINALASEAAAINNALGQNEARAIRSGSTEAQRVEEELVIIARLEDLNSRLVANESASTPVFVERPALSTEISSGHVYLTESQEEALNSLSEVNRAAYVSKYADIKIDTTFIKSSNSAGQEAFIGKTTPIDEKGFKLLESQPNHYQYILASVYADSLKTLEQSQAKLAHNLSAQAVERQVEIARLQNAATLESVAKNKEIILARIPKMEIEMNDAFNRSAIAAEQAEALRSSRIAQEGVVAQKASKLKTGEIAELNALLKTQPYAVISTDLASNKPMASRPKTERAPVVANKPELVKESVEPVIELPSASASSTANMLPSAPNVATAPKARASGLSVDEENLLNSSGNWLTLIEIIGEKDDFSDVVESMFIETERSAYNANTPIPLEVAMPKGLVFQVQIGAFRNPIPQDLYGDIAPITGQKLPNGITRYRAGIFKAYSDAVAAKELVKSKGYSDAFVVAFVDGEQLNGGQAQEILNQAAKILREEMASVPSNETAETLAQGNPTAPSSANTNAKTAASPDLSTTYYNDPQAATAELVETSTGLFFTVQVGVYSKPVKLDALFNLTELNSELTASKLIRYTSGRYESSGAASDRKSEVISKGVADAFITAYYNGRRISIDEANDLLDKEGLNVLNVSSNPKPGQVSRAISAPSQKYVVILGKFAGDIPQDVANTFLDRSDLQVSRVSDPVSGNTTYYSQFFENRSAAEAFLSEIQKSGLSELSIGTLVEGQLITKP